MLRSSNFGGSGASDAGGPTTEELELEKAAAKIFRARPMPNYSKLTLVDKTIISVIFTFKSQYILLDAHCFVYIFPFLCVFHVFSYLGVVKIFLSVLLTGLYQLPGMVYGGFLLPHVIFH